MNAPVRLAVLGDPLVYTLSPVLHRAGLEALGIDGSSEALRTPLEQLGARLAALEVAGYRGVNLTHPLKHAVLDHLHQVSEPARAARSVNTLSFDSHGRIGDTTDGDGFMDWLATLRRDAEAERAVLLGAGGAARSVALALASRGARVVAAARRAAAVLHDWRAIPGAEIVAWPSRELDAALSDATLVVNATPVSDVERPVPIERLPRRALIVDLTYGSALTPWIRSARAQGVLAYDGLGMLVGQARRSLGVWFGTPPPFGALARAVGWPR